MKHELEKLAATDGAMTFFYEDADAENVREFLNGASSKCKVAAGFIGRDGDYRFIIRSDKIDLKDAASRINEAISGRGGGSPAMIRGNCTAARSEIENFFDSI